MISIVLIIPFFGKLPQLFQLWLLSVRYNPTVHFVLITDTDITFEYPSNVKVAKMSFEDCRQLIESKYDFPIVLTSPYKLCDYKPAYGIIFSDFVQGYDFWGFCDLDMIFGDIRKFVTDKLLTDYDRLFFHGHFALTRNTEECNRVYEEKSEDCDYYQDVFQTSRNMYFDECMMWHSSTQIWKNNHPERCYMEQPYDDILAPLWKGRNYHFKTNRFKSSFCSLLFRYDQGSLQRLYLNGFQQQVEDSLYVHLQKRGIAHLDNLSNRFLLVPNKLLPFRERIPILKQIWYGHERIIYRIYGSIYHFFQLKWHALRSS